MEEKKSWIKVTVTGMVEGVEFEEKNHEGSGVICKVVGALCAHSGGICPQKQHGGRMEPTESSHGDRQH